MIHFFAGYTTDKTALSAGSTHDVVGNNVEFFLRFTLNIFATGRTQHAGQCPLTDFKADFFASTGQVIDQSGQPRINTMMRFQIMEVEV